MGLVTAYPRKAVLGLQLIPEKLGRDRHIHKGALKFSWGMRLNPYGCISDAGVFYLFAPSLMNAK